jgi:23S rRNA (uracil1939-C5)-methyltransferase
LGIKTTLDIKRLSLGGEGIGHAEGRVVFVPYTAPGDTVDVEIIQSQKRFARARLLKVVKPSMDRLEPPCPYYYRCGGCTWQHLSYDAQLRAKRDLVQETLERIGKVTGVTVKPVLGMKDPWRYRNKVQQPVGWNGKRLISGFYAEGSHDIVPIEDCLVQPELSVKIINRTKALLEQHGLRAYDDRRNTGWIRHLLVRSSKAGKAMLVFVTRSREFPQESKIIPFLMREFPELIGIHQNVNPGRTNVILGREWRRIYGQDQLEDYLGGLKFRLSPGAFFQVNSSQAEVLYNVARSMAGRGERLLDLYTGVGTIALWLASNFKEVGGVEENPAAIRDAELNAELNGIENVRFAAQSTESFLGSLRRDPRRSLTVVVDPPRAGCTPIVLKSLLALKPTTLVYVSCDPGTLARDLAVLVQGGYLVRDIQPVDLFPHTSHIETAVKLTPGRWNESG